MKYRINEQKVFSDITDGIAILIEVDTGIYYGFNALTTSVFENIISGADTDELLDKLSGIKGFGPEIKDKFLSFVDELVKKEFILETNQGSGPVGFGFTEFENDEYDFAVSEFKDVAELLLADPIHHVKEDKGWRPGKDSLK